RTATDCIEDTGGLFVSTRWDDPGFGDDFLRGCQATGVPVEEVPVAEVLRREPRLDPGLTRAFAVPDANLDPWKLVSACTRSATDVRVADPDELEVTPGEIDEMLDEGERLVPGFREARALRVWAGARPLYTPDDVADTRDVSRTHTVLDHAKRDGVEGFITITGGKTTTFRLMAEHAVDTACEKLG